MPKENIYMLKKILIFFGPPGSGKGTQAAIIGKKMRLPVISIGDLFRREIDKKTILGKRISKILANGKLVDDKTVAVIINERLAGKDLKKGFILDGYPRNKIQNEILAKKIILLNSGKNKNKIFAIFIEVSDKEVLSRLSGRLICFCGATYHLIYNPPKKKGICDKCGRSLKIRKDDQAKVISQRLRIYRRQTKPILDYWRKSDKLIKVNGRQKIKKVSKEIIKKLSVKLKI